MGCSSYWTKCIFSWNTSIGLYGHWMVVTIIGKQHIRQHTNSWWLVKCLWHLFNTFFIIPRLILHSTDPRNYLNCQKCNLAKKGFLVWCIIWQLPHSCFIFALFWINIIKIRLDWLHRFDFSLHIMPSRLKCFVFVGMYY